jgi:transposase
VHLESLPPYAPGLNPDEGVWQHLKHVEMRNLCCDNLHHLYGELSLAIKRLRQKPHIVQSFSLVQDWLYERLTFQCNDL